MTTDLENRLRILAACTAAVYALCDPWASKHLDVRLSELEPVARAAMSLAEELYGEHETGGLREATKGGRGSPADPA